MESMFLRKATVCDLPQAWRIICDAKCFMAAKGSVQWTNDYPSQADIEADVRSGEAYVLCGSDGLAAAYAVVKAAPEPAYAAPTAHWITGGPYVTVHRMAAGEAFRGKGYGRKTLVLCEDVCRHLDAYSIRIDTNYDNVEMLGLIRSLGYTPCGTVSYGPRGERLAFEKVVCCR